MKRLRIYLVYYDYLPYLRMSFIGASLVKERAKILTHEFSSGNLYVEDETEFILHNRTIQLEI